MRSGEQQHTASAVSNASNVFETGESGADNDSKKTFTCGLHAGYRAFKIQTEKTQVRKNCSVAIQGGLYKRPLIPMQHNSCMIADVSRHWSEKI